MSNVCGVRVGWRRSFELWGWASFVLLGDMAWNGTAGSDGTTTYTESLMWN